MCFTLRRRVRRARAIVRDMEEEADVPPTVHTYSLVMRACGMAASIIATMASLASLLTPQRIRESALRHTHPLISGIDECGVGTIAADQGAAPATTPLPPPRAQ